MGDPSDANTPRGGRVTTHSATCAISYATPVTPGDIFLDDVSRLQRLDQACDMFSVRFAKAPGALNAASQNGQDVMAHLITAAELAEIAQNDMDWKATLSNNKHRGRAIATLEDDQASLEATIITEVNTTDADYEDEIKYACPGSLLLHSKRSLVDKVRAVKHGSREESEQAGGLLVFGGNDSCRKDDPPQETSKSPHRGDQGCLYCIPAVRTLPRRNSYLHLFQGPMH